MGGEAGQWSRRVARSRRARAVPPPQVRYKALSFGGAKDSLSVVPCGVCPVFSDCSEGGAISPATCTYMDEWLQF